MIKVAEEIFATKTVLDRDGNSHKLHSETDKGQCLFLQQVIEDNGGSQGIEIGLAYGLSTLFICESISGKKDRHLVSIDPFQEAHWKNIGLANIERAGYSDFVDFHSEFSYLVLPKLLAEGRRFDFAYVDTSKQFEIIMTDAFYLSRLLKVGGIMIFDDCLFPGIQKAMRLVSQWPHFEIIGRLYEANSTALFSTASKLAKLGPSRLFNDDLNPTWNDLGTNAHCIVFRKTAEDERGFDWHKRF